jgi:hypothetical protein
MAAQDIKRDLTAWIRDEIANTCFGEDYGYALSWAPVPAQGPQGMVAVPAWQLLITCPNPLLGQGDLYHMVPPQALGFTRPREADVRREVADGIRQLRELAKSKISGSNGQPKQAVPG